ncbi:fimbrial protein, partial [Pseudomonas aeruginosa]
TVILDSVPVSALDVAVGRSAGETAFTRQPTGCVAPTADALFQATNPSAAGQVDRVTAHAIDQLKRHARRGAGGGVHHVPG